MLYYYSVFAGPGLTDLLEVTADVSSDCQSPTASIVIKVKKKYPRHSMIFSKMITQEDFELLRKMSVENKTLVYEDLS